MLDTSETCVEKKKTVKAKQKQKVDIQDRFQCQESEFSGEEVGIKCEVEITSVPVPMRVDTPVFVPQDLRNVSEVKETRARKSAVVSDVPGSELQSEDDVSEQQSDVSVDEGGVELHVLWLDGADSEAVDGADDVSVHSSSEEQAADSDSGDPGLEVASVSD